MAIPYHIHIKFHNITINHQLCHYMTTYTSVNIHIHQYKFILHIKLQFSPVGLSLVPPMCCLTPVPYQQSLHLPV